MKKRASVRKICTKCRLIRRRGRIRVLFKLKKLKILAKNQKEEGSVLTSNGYIHIPLTPIYEMIKYGKSYQKG